MLARLLYWAKKPYHLIKTGLLRGLPAQIQYGFPANKLKIITITGTDGKTTTSTLTYHLLKAAGKKVGLITTVAAYIGDQEIDTGLHVTTPDPKKLQAFMAKMVKEKFEYLVLEFTSHGAYQYRTWGIKPAIAGVTNVTHEHLDYHLDMETYIAAKAMLLKKAPVVILNKDDSSFNRFKKILKGRNKRILAYSQEDPISEQLKKAIQQRFKEAYNQMNARLVIAIGQQLKIDEATIAQAITTFTGVPGRMQPIPNQHGFQVIVDFAHTPNALEKALTSLRQQLDQQKTKGKLIAVYGCAGLRDRGKRPMMGKIGTEIADLAVFTAEDPRTEDIWSIIRQMKEQLTTGHDKIVSIADRKTAIQFALTKLARKGDIVGIFGKGPEKSMCYGKTEIAWSDVEVAQQTLADRHN